MSRSVVLAAFASLVLSAASRGEDGATPDFATGVAPILKAYCAGCHNDDDREGEFSLDGEDPWEKGTSRGPLVKPGDSASSLLIRQMTGQAKPAMPPKGKPRPSDAEIARVAAWIDAGARRPAAAPADRLALVVPKIVPRAKVRPVTALDLSRDGRWRAVARYGEVELFTGSFETPTMTLRDFPGKVTAVHFSPDGTRFVTASGVVGLGGVAALWNVADGTLIRRFDGHRDILLDAELSPDGKVLATCGYDRTIQLWDAETGKSLRTLLGHNGAVNDVGFSPDGRFLVSASSDDTCKVWRVGDGTRMDTLPQPLKEEYACTFSPDGRYIVAGGADCSIRVWEFVSRDEPKINPMILARFAHEGPITRLAYSPDGSRLVTVAEDRTIKVWDTAHFSEMRLWEHEPDIATALAASGDGRGFGIGRIDGTTAHHEFPASSERASTVASPSSTASPAGSAAGEPTKIAEREPNNTPGEAAEVVLPAQITGVIADPADVDLFRFAAKAGEEWVLEVNASRSGSKLDSFLEVVDAQGKRIERVKLQATRDSYFTFRGKNDAVSGDFRVFNWEEMHLDEYLYANGEVVKLWLHPRGPDSGFLVYPGEGKRWGYFDTTPMAHALGEPCYVVEPHPPGSTPTPNGLPVFSLAFENDDDARRELGRDSRLTFTAPADGSYLAKVRDVRGSGGADHGYTLAIRPRRPDFGVTLSAIKAAITPGGAQEFTARASRIDGYDGPIRVAIEGLPPGISASTPLIIEAGQVEALGVIAAAPDAKAPTPEQAGAIRVAASAVINGEERSHPVKFAGMIKLAPAPALRLAIAPDSEGDPAVHDDPDGGLTVDIDRGQTITLKVRVERNGHVGPVPLGNEGAGRNLPFGVYVDNIGLNGLLITEQQAERTFFITADRAATPQSRKFHLRTTAAGGQASLPVTLRVR
ncbi:c-type cytochrome domain-containing protein [Tundrisphaera sp. TA3]|uniref:c-type cytochrome domain-containing protein n=1 Tax=Tundrisphaera sp. TA3 TaxID=3435775 RepID=UPI003EBF7519